MELTMPDTLNTWILIIPLWFVGMIITNIYRKGVKKLADMSWYKPEDKIASWGSMIVMYLFMIFSIFVPIKFTSIIFWAGILFIIIGFLGHFAAKISFVKTKEDEAVISGIYKISRNPMYTFLSLVMIGTSLVGQSIILGGLWLLSFIFMHKLVIGEERYCIEKYGSQYSEYYKKTPRYLFF